MYKNVLQMLLRPFQFFHDLYSIRFSQLFVEYLESQAS